ncbi:hypothetical protein PYCC9005_000078 [Savitreella phatthalungensis]
MSPRIPYVDNDLPGQAADAVRQRRGSGRLLELDRMLLHNQDMALGWNALMGAVRQKNSLPGSIRELVICYIAVLNRAEYEWGQHAPEALAEGVSQAKLDALQRGDVSELDETEQLAMEYTRAMTLDVDVPDTLADRVKQVFGSAQTVELTMTAASYNMVSRFLVALHVGR